MPRKSLLLLSFFFLSLSLEGRAQDAGGNKKPTNDPLDVIESPENKTPPAEPSVPEFTEVTPPGDAAAPNKTAEKAPEKAAEVAQPQPPVAAEPNPDVQLNSAKEVQQTEERPPRAVGDEPDLHKEERFHKIYKQYNEQPTSDEAWEKAVGDRKAQVYKVHKGDTLWEVSNTLFGDPQYWPKVWSLNTSQIANPHEINPDMAIQFFPGTMDDPPTLAIVKKDESEEKTEVEESPVPEPENPIAPEDIPKSKKHSKVLKELPPSIPLYRLGSVSIPPVEVQIPPPKLRTTSAPEYLTYFAAKETPPSVGVIIETEMGTTTATDYQYVMVHMDSPGAKDFVAIRNLEPLHDPRDPKKGIELIEIQGVVEVMEKVNENNVYRAMVKKSIQPINVGAKLIAGPMPMFDPTPTAVTSLATATIFGGQYENDRKQFATHSVVFIDAGSGQGVQEGQSLHIYSDVRKRNKGTRALMNDRIIGTVKVIKVTDSFATAYVTNATDDVFIGDHVGSSPVVNTVEKNDEQVRVSSSLSKGGDEELALDEIDNASAKEGAKPVDEAPADSGAPVADPDFEL